MKPTSTWLASVSFGDLFYQPVFGALELPKVDLGYEVHQAISFNVRLHHPWTIHLFLTLVLGVQSDIQFQQHSLRPGSSGSAAMGSSSTSHRP
jgi:hypothetical protein